MDCREAYPHLSLTPFLYDANRTNAWILYFFDGLIINAVASRIKLEARNELAHLFLLVAGDTSIGCQEI